MTKKINDSLQDMIVSLDQQTDISTDHTSTVHTVSWIYMQGSYGLLLLIKQRN